jgi:UPF0755 protein
VKKIIVLLVILFIIFPLTLFFTFFFISGPTKEFPVGKYFDIKSGMTVSSIGKFLEKEKIIKSATVFGIYHKFKSLGENNFSGPKAGKYLFKKKLDVFEIYSRLKNGESGIDPIKITFLEGMNNFEVATIIDESKKIIDFDKEKFLEISKNNEGYLYPDTYEFLPFDTEEMIMLEMRENFDKKTKKVIKEIKNSNKSLDKIMIMASLIEEEAGNASR